MANTEVLLDDLADVVTALLRLGQELEPGDGVLAAIVELEQAADRVYELLGFRPGAGVVAQAGSPSSSDPKP